MTDFSPSNSTQTLAPPRSRSYGDVSNQNTEFIWPAALLILGLMSTFAWVAFLGWVLVMVFEAAV